MLKKAWDPMHVNRKDPNRPTEPPINHGLENEDSTSSQQPAASNQQPASSQQPAASQQQAAGTRQPAASSQQPVQVVLAFFAKNIAFVQVFLSC